MTGRRCKLPSPKPDDSNVSLFSLLRKNIGKDLSKVSMPVSLNEPLSLLQVRVTHVTCEFLPVYITSTTAACAEQVVTMLFVV